jgi:hypothetical protein
MTDSRLALAKVLSIAGLAIFSTYYVDELAKDGGTAGGFLPVANPVIRGLSFQLSTLVPSAAAFALSWKKPSLLLSAALFIAGVLMVIDGISIGTRYFTVLVLPGPIIGFAYGLAILVLGIIKSIQTGMLKTTEAK